MHHVGCNAAIHDLKAERWVSKTDPLRLWAIGGSKRKLCFSIASRRSWQDARSIASKQGSGMSPGASGFAPCRCRVKVTSFARHAVVVTGSPIDRIRRGRQSRPLMTIRCRSELGGECQEQLPTERIVGRVRVRGSARHDFERRERWILVEHVVDAAANFKRIAHAP